MVEENVPVAQLVTVRVVTPLIAPDTLILPEAPALRVRAVLLDPSDMVDVKLILSPAPAPEVMVVVTAPASRSTAPVNVIAPVVEVYVVSFKSMLVPVMAMAPEAVTSMRSTWEADTTVRDERLVLEPASADRVTVPVPAVRARELAPFMALENDMLLSVVLSVSIARELFSVTAPVIDTAPAVPPEVVSIVVAPDMVVVPSVTTSPDVVMAAYMDVGDGLEALPEVSTPPLRVNVSPELPNVTVPVFRNSTRLVITAPPFNATLYGWLAVLRVAAVTLPLKVTVWASVVSVNVMVVAFTVDENVVVLELVIVRVVTPLTAPDTLILPEAPALRVRAVLEEASDIVDEKLI